MADKIRIGFVGCGFMGQSVHLPSFRKCKDAEILAISDLRPKLAKAVSERWGIKKTYPSHLELVEDKELDAVVVITNKFTHAEIVIDAIRAGKHVFVEKPMATTAADAKMMADTAQKYDTKLMVGYMKRYDPGIHRAKEIFSELKKDDRITFARTHCFDGEWICGPTAEPMISTEEKYPDVDRIFPEFLPQNLFGTMDWLLEEVHDINLPRFFLGDPVSVEYFRVWPGSFVGFLSYEEFPLAFEMGEISSDFYDEQLIIYFKNSWLEVRAPPPLLRNVPARVHVYRAGGIQRDEYPHGGWSWAFEREAQHFIDCILRDERPLSDGSDSYKDIAIIEDLLKKAMEKEG